MNEQIERSQQLEKAIVGLMLIVAIQFVTILLGLAIIVDLIPVEILGNNMRWTLRGGVMLLSILVPWWAIQPLKIPSKSASDVKPLTILITSGRKRNIKTEQTVSRLR